MAHGQITHIEFPADDTARSIHDIVARASGLGGKVITSRTEIVGQGWYGVILDSEGSELGLYEGRSSA